MTTRVSTQDEQTGHGRRTPLVMTALTLAVLGAFALWQLRPGGEEAATPAAISATERSVTTAPATDGVIPVGGLAERYHEEARTGVDTTALRVATAEEATAAYSQYIERLRALDGATPVDVTVVVDSTASTEAQGGASGSTVSPAHC